MRVVFLLLFLFSFFVRSNGSPSVSKEEEKFDPTEMIMHHISDSHEWHIISFHTLTGKLIHLTLPLPIIVWQDGKLWSFFSYKFHGGDISVPIGDKYLSLYHGHLYLTDAQGTIHKGENDEILNQSPVDFSITKNVASMFLSAILLILIFGTAARQYSRIGGLVAPKGIVAVVEPIVLFVRDDIIKDMIHGRKANFFTPYLLTLFFFIWINNLIGLIPFFPGGSNLSGNISFTLTLATVSFLATNIFAGGHYWREIFIAPGIPVFIKPLLIIVEFVGIFTKPFALMLRLFANITAGHIIILSLTSIIFVLQTIYAAPLTILTSLMMFSLEFLVALLQAYIFTLLTALFIGMAVNESNH
jgi:F-type H+-transporting ATPase subunit a